MCGIGGIISNSNEFIKSNIKKIVRAIIHQERRGTDAAGIYVIDKEFLDKEPIPMRYFLTERIISGTITIEDIKRLLFHTRAATKGNPSINENNHPFETDDLVFAHNGILYNDDEIRRTYDLPKFPETDSYIIGALIQKFLDDGKNIEEAIKEAIEKIRGWMALWIFYKPTKTLYLYRNDRPIEFIYEENKYFIFASELDVIFKDVKALEEYTLYKLNIDKVKLEKVTNIYSFSTIPINNIAYTNRSNYDLLSLCECLVEMLQEEIVRETDVVVIEDMEWSITKRRNIRLEISVQGGNYKEILNLSFIKDYIISYKVKIHGKDSYEISLILDKSILKKVDAICNMRHDSYEVYYY